MPERQKMAAGKTKKLPPKSVDPVTYPDTEWIRIQWGPWIHIQIRIRNPDPDPGGQKVNIFNFLILFEG
jgi:hypothetical protein